MDAGAGCCHVWIPGNGPLRQMAEGYGLAHHLCDSPRLLRSNKLQMVIANGKFGHVLRRHGPGIMHVHWPHAYGALRYALRLSGLKRIVHVQIEEDPAGLRWALKDPPDMIITCAKYLVEYVRRFLPEIHQKRQRIVAVPNAVDTDQFFPTEKREAKCRIGARGVPLILVLANLAPHKGQETAIRAVAELKNRGMEVACWLAGVERDREGSYTIHLRSLISELGVEDRIQLLGYRNDTAELLQAADLFLLPSTHEGLPISILEAQATKVPVFAAPTAGIPEVVSEGETGFLIPAKDHIGYANSIQALLNNQTLYHRVAQNAFDQVRREYTWTAYFERIQHLYCELLNDGQTQPGANPVMDKFI